jgi:putative membrane protein
MIGAVLVGLIAVLHLYILVLEMFLWETAVARRAFGTTEVFAANTRVLAANQGLYNGFLAAGLIWALWLGLPGAGREEAIFFLSCVLAAGVYGGLTASRRILFVQAIPAALALIAVFLQR